MSEIIAFTKVKLPYGWMSNMAPYPVEHDGKRWEHTEGLFQALRFDDEVIREKIRLVSNPMLAKELAMEKTSKMSIKPMSEQDVDNMKLCVELKLKFHQELRDGLILTKDKWIVEDTTSRIGGRHQFWGAAKDEQTGYWKGDNILGKIWMEAREKLQQK